MTAAPDRELYVCMATDPNRCEIGDAYWAYHRCVDDDGHDGPHECACGHQWGDDDA